MKFAATQFAVWLKSLRAQTALDQEALAARAGVSVDQVRRVERGENVGIWYIAAMLCALADAEASRGYESLAERMRHPVFAALWADGQAAKNSGVFEQRRRKQPLEEKARRRAAPR